jgi:hypothetical protein
MSALSFCLSKEDVLDEALPHEVGAVEKDADGDTRDEDDDDSLDQLALPRPLDLLELSPRLRDEVLDAASGNAPLTDLGARRRRTRGARSRSALNRDFTSAVTALGPSRPSLCARLPSHA